jgi:hypothetical protein
LNRDDCPEALWQLKLHFDKVFSQHLPKDYSKNHQRPTEIVHIFHNGRNYSHASTHLGNSLILYYPSLAAVAPIAGSIQKIMVCGEPVQLTIRQQALLCTGVYDLFIRYPSFPAQLYSLEMDDGMPDAVPLTCIISHVARFIFGPDQAVILNLSRVGLKSKLISTLIQPLGMIEVRIYLFMYIY